MTYPEIFGEYQFQHKVSGLKISGNLKGYNCDLQIIIFNFKTCIGVICRGTSLWKNVIIKQLPIILDIVIEKNSLRLNIFIFSSIWGKNLGSYTGCLVAKPLLIRLTDFTYCLDVSIVDVEQVIAD